jgi:hypothetical protein
MKSQCAREFASNLLPSDTARQVLYDKPSIRDRDANAVPAAARIIRKHACCRSVDESPMGYSYDEYSDCRRNTPHQSVAVQLSNPEQPRRGFRIADASIPVIAQKIISSP